MQARLDFSMEANYELSFHLLYFTLWNFLYRQTIIIQGTKIFQHCTCPAGRVTYNFHSSSNTWTCLLKVYAIKNIREWYAIWLPWVILPKALVLQDECFWENYSSVLDFTRNYKRTSGIFVPCYTCTLGYIQFWYLMYIHIRDFVGIQMAA